MKKEDINWHIDVTPEEDALFRDDIEEIKDAPKKSKISFKNIFLGVVGIHCLVAGGIAVSSAEAFQPNNKPNLEKPVADLPKPYQGVVEQTAATPSPTPEVVATPQPTPIVATTPNPLPQQKPQLKPALTKEYTIKKGDTLYSIARKYKLNVERLIQINKIKNPQQIQIGQKIKFM